MKKLLALVLAVIMVLGLVACGKAPASESAAAAPDVNPLSNAKVRKAITLAIDAEAFVKNVVKNSSNVAYSFTPSAIQRGEFTAKVGNLLDREGFAADGYAKAKALLAEGCAELGIKPEDIHLVIVTDEGDVAAANCAFFQEQLKTNLGVDLQVEQMTYKARLERMDQKDFSMVLAGWGPDYNDPMTFMDLWISGNGNNHTSYSNPEYDAIIDAAKKEADPAKYEQLLIDAEKLLMEDLPVGPIYNRKRDYITSDKLSGVIRTAFSDLSFIEAVTADGSDITVNLGSEPPELNSITTTSTGSMSVLRHTVEGLVRLDANDNPIPALAESWDISEDGMKYTFHLKQGLKWSNGADINADDFIFAWDTLFKAETAAPYAGSWAGLIVGAADMLNAADDAAYEAAKANVGYKKVDDYTIEVNLAVPCGPYFTSVMAFPSFYPVDQATYEEMGGLDAYATEAELIVCNGAYVIESWLHEDEIVLVKNPNYYDAANIKINKITMKMISDSATAFNGYQAGELDMIGLKADQVEILNGEGKGDKVLHYDDGSCWYLEFNTVA